MEAGNGKKNGKGAAKQNAQNQGRKQAPTNGAEQVRNQASSQGESQAASPATNGNLWRVKVGLAEMLKGGVIMDVTNAAQARIAEDAGACAVMALERVPSDIRKEGGVARMAATKIIRQIMNTVSIPVMAKVRIGHFVEAQVLEALEVDFIDESEVLTPADEENHVWKHDFRVPFVCGARNLGEALRRISEGAAMIRTKGEAGSGNIVEAVRHLRAITSEMRRLTTLREEELVHAAKELGAPLELVREIAKTGKLPVPNFSAGGIATPADAALVRQLGAEAVFVGSGIFKSDDPERRAKAIVKATTHYNDAKIVLDASEELGEAMKGIDVRQLEEKDLLQTRGW
jgi:pyridoxal 5'-phosphate synthase pdxS subunit